MVTGKLLVLPPFLSSTASSGCLLLKLFCNVRGWFSLSLSIFFSKPLSLYAAVADQLIHRGKSSKKVSKATEGFSVFFYFSKIFFSSQLSTILHILARLSSHQPCSISHSCPFRHQIDYRDTRKATAEHMRANRDDFIPFISDSDEHMAGIENKEAGSEGGEKAMASESFSVVQIRQWSLSVVGCFSRAWHSDEISAAGDLRSRQGGNLVLFSSRLKIRRWVKTVDWNVCCAVVFFSDLNGFRKTIGTSRIETNVYYERHSIQKDRSHGENVKLTTGSFAWAKVQLRVFTSPLSDFHLPFNFSMVSFSHSFPGASSSVIILTPPPPFSSPLPTLFQRTLPRLLWRYRKHGSLGRPTWNFSTHKSLQDSNSRRSIRFSSFESWRGRAERWTADDLVSIRLSSMLCEPFFLFATESLLRS